MKIAILGSDIHALQLAEKLADIQAYVVVFKDGPTHKSEDYLREKVIIKPNKALRVGKRYLRPGELKNASSRFADLFRVVFEVSIDQIQEMGSLTEDMKASLNKSYQSFEDFDLVINTTKTKMPTMAPAMMAIGEEDIPSEFFTKEISPHENVTLFAQGIKGVREFLELRTQQKEKPFSLDILFEDDDGFQGVLGSLIPTLKEELLKELDQLKNEDLEREKHYQDRLHEWDQMDDFVKAKLGKPQKEENPVNFFPGVSVSSANYIADQNKVFISFLSNDFSIDEDQKKLKTIGTDRIVLGKEKNVSYDLVSALEVNPLDERPISQEVGYFNYFAKDTFALDYLAHLKKQEEQIFNEIYRLFSPNN